MTNEELKVFKENPSGLPTSMMTAEIKRHDNSEIVALLAFGRNSIKALEKTARTLMLEQSFEELEFFNLTKGITDNEDRLSQVIFKCSLTLIIIDNTDYDVLLYAGVIARTLRKHDIPVIGIVAGHEKKSEEPVSDIPIELEISDACNSFNSVIPLDITGYPFEKPISEILFEPVQTILRLFLNNKSEKLLLNFSVTNRNFLYYNTTLFREKWDTEKAIEEAIFHLLFICPVYVASRVLLIVNHGHNFNAERIFNGSGDDGIIKSVVEDYMCHDAELQYIFKTDNKLGAFDIEIQFFVSGFGEEAFIFSEDNVRIYPEAESKLLSNRVNRKLSAPFEMQKKRKDFEWYISGKNENSN